MFLEELFEKLGIEDEEKQLQIAYLLANFNSLYTSKEQEETVDPRDLTCYDLNTLYLTEYDYECGAYHDGIWFSLKSVIKSIINFWKDYE